MDVPVLLDSDILAIFLNSECPTYSRIVFSTLKHLVRLAMI